MRTVEGCFKRGTSTGFWSSGNSGASAFILLRSSTVVKRPFSFSLTKDFNDQIRAEVNESWPGTLVVPISSVAARNSNDLNFVNSHPHSWKEKRLMTDLGPLVLIPNCPAWQLAKLVS